MERAAIWPASALFHREPIPSPALRHAWSAQKRAALDDADIVFLDPDNGATLRDVGRGERRAVAARYERVKPTQSRRSSTPIGPQSRGGKSRMTMYRHGLPVSAHQLR